MDRLTIKLQFGRYTFVVEADIKGFFDQVNHDKLMSLIKKRVADRQGLQRIDRDLKAGALTDKGLEATGEGTPPGDPWSPLLANLLLDGLDKEVARLGRRFVRSGDEGHIDVKSVRAGQWVLTSMTRFLDQRLKLAVHAAKSAGDRPWRRTCLGFTFTGRRPNRRPVSGKALQACKAEVGRRTFRTRGESLGRVVGDLRRYRDGWYTSFGVAEASSSFKELDSWMHRRLRYSLWQPWDRQRYRPRRCRGVSRALAWTTVTSAHGPWRISRSLALAIALLRGYVDGLGLPCLHRGAHR